MVDEDRAFLLSRAGIEGGSMEHLISIAHEGNVNNIPPFKPQASVDTRDFQKYDKNNAIAQKQIGSSPLGVFLPNNPYEDEARAAVLQNVYDAVTDPTMGMLAPKGMLIPATMREGKILSGRLGKTHYDMTGVESRAIVKPGEKGPAGFLDHLGNYFNRKDATALLKDTQPDVYRRLDHHSRTVGLESQGYAYAAGLQTEEHALASDFMRSQFGK